MSLRRFQAIVTHHYAEVGDRCKKSTKPNQTEPNPARIPSLVDRSVVACDAGEWTTRVYG